DPAMPDRRRAVHEAPGAVRPAQLATLLAERVDEAVRRAEIDAGVGDGRGRIELAVSAEPVAVRLRAPDQLAVTLAQSVEPAVVGAEEDAPTVVGDRSLDGTARVEGPIRLAVDAAQGVDDPVVIGDVDPVADYGRRRLGRAEVPAPPKSVCAPGG